LLQQQGARQQGSLISRKRCRQAHQHRFGLAWGALFVEQFSQQQTDPQGLGFDWDLAEPDETGFDPLARLAALPLFVQQQAEQLQGFDLVGPLVEQLAQFALCPSRITQITPELSQQQAQAPALRLLIGELLHQSCRFALALERDQQLQLALEALRCGFSAGVLLREGRELLLKSAAITALARPAAAQLAPEPQSAAQAKPRQRRNREDRPGVGTCGHADASIRSGAFSLTQLNSQP
jgi:hypothetical protein